MNVHFGVLSVYHRARRQSHRRRMVSRQEVAVLGVGGWWLVVGGWVLRLRPWETFSSEAIYGPAHREAPLCSV